MMSIMYFMMVNELSLLAAALDKCPMLSRDCAVSAQVTLRNGQRDGRRCTYDGCEVASNIFQARATLQNVQTFKTLKTLAHHACRSASGAEQNSRASRWRPEKRLAGELKRLAGDLRRTTSCRAFQTESNYKNDLLPSIRLLPVLRLALRFLFSLFGSLAMGVLFSVGKSFCSSSSITHFCSSSITHATFNIRAPAMNYLPFQRRSNRSSVIISC